jgi:hypothetical protein
MWIFTEIKSWHLCLHGNESEFQVLIWKFEAEATVDGEEKERSTMDRK